MSATEHGRTVASLVVRYKTDRGRYKLVLPPGRYIVSARGSNDPPRAVVLREREHVIVNFPDYCK